LEAERHINSIVCPHDEGILLFLKAILLDYLTLKQGAFGLILRLDDNAGFFGLAFLDLHGGGI